MKNNWFTHPETLIIGHRGACGDAPENTLKSFLLAQEQGAAGIEFDVRIAKDGVIVCIHDDTLDRTTNTTGNVADFDSAELAQVDAGEGEPIPTLDQVIESCGPDFLYNIEIKDYGEADLGTEAAVKSIIERHNIAEQVVVSSFDYFAMRRAQQLMAGMVGLGWLRTPDHPLIPAWFEGQADHPHFTMINPELMDKAKANNWGVNTWTVNDIEAARILVDLGVTSIITNYPLKMRQALGHES